ncbi:uncharacterized protein LOC117790267 [Drosophila innubila]|uniref:uncharacterized protein LOC117790267 n=1 Tax=Drosophila innubila TaxID=198719 RepID=UPI00148DF21C|nr:uncharacterized protein LOC117790267 [Drosophila innubila]
MYHKAKCRARLVTRITSQGDLIHVTSYRHTHQSMYLLQKLESVVEEKPCLAKNPQCTAIRQMKLELPK